MKILFSALMLLPLIVFCQNGNYKGKGALINSVNGNQVEDVNVTYWTIKNDTVLQYLNNKRTKLFKTNILGVSENEDWKIKWSLKLINENTKEYHLIKQGIDKFTDEKYKIVWFLTKE